MTAWLPRNRRTSENENGNRHLETMENQPKELLGTAETGSTGKDSLIV